MDEAKRRVREAARDASSNDDLVSGEMEMMMWDEHDMLVPIDKETLDERSTGQMGERWESRRRDADD